MPEPNLEEIVSYIVNKSFELKNKYTDEKTAPVEFACIFCQSDNEYQKLDHFVDELGGVVQETSSGKTYLLNKAIQTKGGPLRLLKVRKPDPIRKERGDADFNTSYLSFKDKYINNPRFELIKRDSFEMLRLSDPEFDVMSCFSSIPMGKDLGINLK
jgi:hypothetical protein